MQKKIQLFLFFIAFFSLSNVINAQDIMDIPPLDDEGEPAIAYTIIGDTTATGERVNPNRIYRLERGGIYVLTATIIADYPLSIIAGGDDSQRPPIIVSGKFADGVNIRPMFEFTGDGNRHEFKNLIFNGVDLDREYDAEWIKGLIFSADDISASFEGCVFNAFTGGATRFDGANASIYFRDCVWRNGVSPTHMFIGQQVTMPALPVDTLIVTNNTYFNNNAFWLFQENGLAKFAIIEHNTIFTSLIDMMRLRFTSNAYIRSNIFYGTHAYGDSEESQSGTWYEPDGSPYSIISLYDVPSELLDEAGLTEAERTVILTNNAYFSPAPIKNYWDTHDGISGPTWMNTRTQAFFDDELGHPNFIAHSNVEQDPNFTDTVMDEWVVGKVADYCTTYRATLTPGSPLSGDAGDNRNYDEEQGVDILAGLQWPLPESMAYQNSELLVGGHDGLPVGDLNWDPDLREQYIEPTEITTDLREPTAAAGNYDLKQNYPNPFSTQTVITFNIPEKGMTKLGVYDMFGKEIKSLVNEALAAGRYQFEFDTKNLIPGAYFYKLQSGNFTGVKKMTILK